VDNNLENNNLGWASLGAKLPFALTVLGLRTIFEIDLSIYSTQVMTEKRKL
jgi:hypothetical protein